MSTALNTLYATRQRVSFRALETLRLPEFQGATFRGALGFAFRKVACALPLKQCETCLLRLRCAYSVCFETPVPEGAAVMRKYPYAPHPFVLSPAEPVERTHEPGGEFGLELILVGRGNDYVPQFIYAFEELGNQGIGRDRAKAELLSVACLAGDAPRVYYDHAAGRLDGEAAPIRHGDIEQRAEALAGKPLRVTFETPVRVKLDGSMLETPAMRDLFPSLLRRLHTLNYFHCGGVFPEDVRPLLDLAAAVESRACKTAWVAQTRYSSRQQARMGMGGFTGYAEYDNVAPELLPYLLWGEHLHVGKSSAFGLGKYRLQPAD